MARYTYTLTDLQNHTQKGIIHAESTEEAAVQIKKSGWYITSLQEGAHNPG